MGDAALNYRVEGNGPPLLLVHGFGISFNIWSKLRPLLSTHFTLVMVELPGIGATPLPPEGEDYLQACVAGIACVRHSLGMEKWNVLGYSTGSRIAEAYVHSDARHVRCAVFLCPLTVGANKKRLLSFGLWLDQLQPAFGTWLLSGWRLKFLISWLGFNLQRDPRLDQWYGEIGARPVRILKETIRAVAAEAEGPFSVPVPYALIWGDRDLVPRRPRMPGEQDRVVRGRHAAPVESAGEVAEAVISFAADQSINKHR